MTFFIIASVLAVALSLLLHRMVDHDGSETARTHPPRSHQVDTFGRVPTDLR